MGNTDRVVRTLIAAVAVVLFATDTVNTTVGIVLMAVAGIFLLTSLVSFCPVYAIFGWKTCKT